MNVGDNVAIDQTITVEGVATTTQDPATPPTGQAYTKTTSSSYQDSNEVAVQLGDNVSLQVPSRQPDKSPATLIPRLR